MRFASPTFAVALVLSGCAFNAGAGVGARVGGRPGEPNVECDDFESCDVAYQQALAEAARCHEDGVDCDDEEQNVAASYRELRERTQGELDALRNELRERDGELELAEPPEGSPPEREAEPPSRNRAPEPVPSARHGNGWFDADQPAK